MKSIFFFLVALQLSSCAVKKNTSASSTPDSNYGYNKENPVMTGGSVLGEINYLKSIEYLDGGQVIFKRLGSCCGFSSKESATGYVILDIYEITRTDGSQKVTLYLDMYRKKIASAPQGFKFKQKKE